MIIISWYSVQGLKYAEELFLNDITRRLKQSALEYLHLVNSIE